MAKRSSNSARFVRVKELAGTLRISPRSIQRLVEAGMPRSTRGKYNLYQCVRWYALDLAKKVEEKRDKYPERTRLMRIQTDLLELKLSQLRSEFIPVDFYRELVAAYKMEFRRALLPIPSQMAPQLEGENRGTIKAKLDQMVYGVLTALSRGEYHRKTKYEEKNYC
jgi:phage terminase Nu1 subunit (DNA packaging protein)